MVRQGMSRGWLAAVAGTVTILAGAACGGEDVPSNRGTGSASPTQSSATRAALPTGTGEDDIWGPLAVSEDSVIEFALAPAGVVWITQDCTYLRVRDGTLLMLVWPEGRTRWDSAAHRITFTNLSGQEVEVESGQRVRLGGGGTSLQGPEAESGDQTPWVAPPHRSCVMTHQWRVGGVLDD